MLLSHETAPKCSLFSTCQSQGTPLSSVSVAPFCPLQRFACKTLILPSDRNLSSSRSKKMNAVRLRKENAVISVEQRRQLAQLALEEKALRENAVVSSLRDMVSKKADALGKGQ